jgi:hypothetical protein
MARNSLPVSVARGSSDWAVPVWRAAGGRMPMSNDGSAGEERTLLPPTERSLAELTPSRHLARAVEDLLTVAPIELALRADQRWTV